MGEDKNFIKFSTDGDVRRHGELAMGPMFRSGTERTNARVAYYRRLAKAVYITTGRHVAGLNPRSISTGCPTGKGCVRREYRCGIVDERVGSDAHAVTDASGNRRCGYLAVMWWANNHFLLYAAITPHRSAIRTISNKDTKPYGHGVTRALSYIDAEP